MARGTTAERQTLEKIKMKNYTEYLTPDAPEQLKHLIEESIRQNRQKLKLKLLNEARGKQPLFFYQYDGMLPGDGAFPGDDDGDVFFTSGSWELIKAKISTED